MSGIQLTQEGNPALPGVSELLIFPDSSTLQAAFANSLRRFGTSRNASVANQTVNAVDTYMTDSDLIIPSFGMQARTMFRWRFSASKTAAGVTAPVYSVRIGVNRTTGDTARLQITGPAQTGVIDTGVCELLVVLRNVGAAAILQGTVSWKHNVAAGGFANNDAGCVEATSASFDSTTMAGQYIGLSVNSSALGVWTVTQLQAEAHW